MKTEAIEVAKRGTSLCKNGKGQVIREYVYRSCHDINIVKKLTEEVVTDCTKTC